MIFLDKVRVIVLSGNGGDGKISFIKKGNKKIFSGGQGGDGGDVYINVNEDLNDLNFFYNNKVLRSSSGKNGCFNFRKGKKGRDLIINIPKGTIIKDLNNNKIIFNSILYKKNLLIKGGKGGRCGKKFNFKGLNGKRIELLFDFNILSSLVLIGPPNSGKSTFINFLSNSKSIISNYSFSTTKPIIGVLNFNFKKKIIILDLPGIINNSYNNIGLGLYFLKHITYCKIIFYFIDFLINDLYFIKSISILNNELYKYNKYYFYKSRVLFLNKIDLNYNIFFVDFFKNIFLFINFFYFFFFISSKKKLFYKKFFFIIYNNVLF